MENIFEDDCDCTMYDACKCGENDGDGHHDCHYFHLCKFLKCKTHKKILRLRLSDNGLVHKYRDPNYECPRYYEEEACCDNLTELIAEHLSTGEFSCNICIEKKTKFILLNNEILINQLLTEKNTEDENNKNIILYNKDDPNINMWKLGYGEYS